LVKILSFLPGDFFLQGQFLWLVVCCWKMLKRQSITSLLQIHKQDENETTKGRIVIWLMKEQFVITHWYTVL
jgi:hypothetical protein